MSDTNGGSEDGIDRLNAPVLPETGLLGGLCVARHTDVVCYAPLCRPPSCLPLIGPEGKEHSALPARITSRSRGVRD